MSAFSYLIDKFDAPDAERNLNRGWEWMLPRKHTKCIQAARHSLHNCPGGPLRVGVPSLEIFFRGRRRKGVEFGGHMGGFL